jgi:cleavage and polyadenylation specificity factor subunit 3
MRLKSKLLSLNASLPASRKVKVFSPRNCEELRIPFKADKVAKVVGKLANAQPLLFSQKEDSSSAYEIADTNGGKIITGVLVENDFKLSLMAPEDLREYAGLTTTVVMCKQRLRLSTAGVDLIRWALEGTFGSIEEIPVPEMEPQSSNGSGNGDIHVNGSNTQEDADVEFPASRQAAFLVMGCVTVRWHSNGEVDLQWEGNMLSDGVADAILAVLFSVESSPAAVRCTSCHKGLPTQPQLLLDSRLTSILDSPSKNPCSHTLNSGLPSRNPLAKLSPSDRLERLFMFLEAQFGSDSLTPIETPKLPSTLRNYASHNIKITLKSHESDPESDQELDANTDLLEVQKNELERLQKLGIPVPGIEIKVDKMVARVWLEDLEVECANRGFGDRVRVVVERAVEVVAPLWG